jgi:hypothetical protein
VIRVLLTRDNQLGIYSDDMRQERASYTAAPTCPRCKRDKHCLVSQVQATAADAETTYADETKNPNFTFLFFANIMLNRNISCCSPKLDKLPQIKVRAFCFIGSNAF